MFHIRYFSVKNKMVEDQDINRKNGESDWPIPLDLKALKNHSLPAFIIFILLITIYSNSFDCSWHFDDYANIVNNGAVHIRSLSWGELEKSMHGISASDRWSRPLSYVSFALNYHFHGLDVFGYHVVNFIIHYLTAFFLYLFILVTLRLPVFNGRYEDRAQTIALLSAVLWAINPLQVGAVTYIVQRMASLAALFYILSMLFFLKGRMADQAGKRRVLFLFSVITGILSISAKENAAILPLTLLLFDLILIQGFSPENIKRSLKYVIPAVLSILGIAFLFFESIPSIIGDYSIRPFTPWERLMTEPRVVLFYISLLLYPITERLTLIHEFGVSTSLTDPWTTGAAILVILVVLILALLKARKWPLISYCLIFFFLNHVIEGSFISLELVFEHRNYVPSMLFFVPLSLFFVALISRFLRRKVLCLFLTLAMSIFIMLQGLTVYIQNNIWKNEISLWRDNVEKAPRVHHVRQNLATAYFIEGRLPEALEELNKALESYSSADITKKARTHGLMAEYYLLQGDQDKALHHSLEGLKLNPQYHQSYHRIAEILLQREQSPDDAEDAIKKAIVLNNSSSTYRLTYAKILLRKGLPGLAKQEVKAALLLDPDSAESYKIMAGILKQQGHDKVSEHFSRIASTKERLAIK